MSEQTLGGIPPIGLGLVVEDKPSELSCTYTGYNLSGGFQSEVATYI